MYNAIEKMELLFLLKYFLASFEKKGTKEKLERNVGKKDHLGNLENSKSIFFF